ncbi:testis-expressed protein 52 [Hyperolius riggenbachi]|uniref:testis-expressed protein 52 n=1 Tax=Hyperolius riggenbachi TaxID=752182 RepID=UPI0035A2B773
MAATLSKPHPVPLLSDLPVHSPGFMPRGIHKILLKNPPYTDAKLELLRKLRSPLNAEPPPPYTQGYLTWLEVSRLPPLLPLRPDRPYDSAVWRQLTSAPANPGSRDPVPPPSRMEANTWGRFICCSGMRRDEKECYALQIRSQGRVPPTDSQGNILPPARFKQYAIHVGASKTDVVPPVPGPSESGFFSAPQHQHKPRIPTLQKNSPSYSQILQKYQELQRGARSVAPYNSRMTTPRTTKQVPRS